MSRSHEDVVDIAVLDQLAGIHRQHARTRFGDDADIVGDEHECRPRPLAELDEHIDDLRLNRDIECRRRLVGDDQFGLANQRDGDHDALPHAAGQLVRVVLHALCRQRNSHLIQGIDRADPRLPGADREMGADGLRYLMADGENGIERTHRLLKDHR